MAIERKCPAKRGVCLMLAAAVILTLGQVVSFDFISYDDPIYVTGNEQVRRGLSAESLGWALTGSGQTNLWHPLTWWSHMLDVQLFGLESASGHHAVNLVWHLLASMGLFALLKKLTGQPLLAGILALLWAVHPLRLQSVAWVSARKDVLSGAFFFWSWWFWEEWLQRRKRRSYGLSLAAFAAAALAKPAVVPLSVILFLVQALREGSLSQSFKKWVGPVLPFFLTALVVSAWTLFLQRTGGHAGVADSLPVGQRVLLLPYTFWWYLEHFLWPGERILWIYPPDSFFQQGIKPLLALGLLAGLVYRWRLYRIVWWGGLAFVLLWLPVSGLIPVSFYMVADRYSYLLHAALVLALAPLVANLAGKGRNWSRGIHLGLGLLVVLLALVACWQARLWRDSETLFVHERRENPRSLLAPIHLGAERMREGRWEDAFRLFEEAQEIDRNSGLAATNAGEALWKLGRKEEAKKWLVAAGQKSILHNERPFRILAQIELADGVGLKALSALEAGLQRFPGSVPLLLDRAALQLGSLRDVQSALQSYEAVLRREPRNADALQGQAVCLIELGQVERGRALLQQLLHKHPERTAVRRYLQEQ
ncbi:tetratricopeptide repeat protein [Roseibacillus ishigakijimensis]|uniref:Tetratricopeptide repeat protein n=1 Tax=Roseibacillus ishigakijimensis TaxID=454146 RepID=A0A934VGQ2_9BACT|nr:tetratricopeptide repeat protein [Roseibacillus ishigakijimensis]MBK1833103.1 tetratricopeptide repeat protein [Roseibacillus ishigakijimensis]